MALQTDTIEVTGIRFPSKDTAIQEGNLKVTVDKDSSSKRFSIMAVREEGKWMLAFIKEWPDDEEEQEQPEERN